MIVLLSATVLLLLLASDPTEDVARLASIETVLVDGEVVYGGHER